MNQEKTNEKRLRILKSAANLIAQKGYYGVGLKEILDTCGIPKGSFYYCLLYTSHAVENQIEDREDHSAYADAGIGEDRICQFQRH